MKRILIADANKASLVMTSEVFKDYFPGVQVSVVKTAMDALTLVSEGNYFDAIIIDYDLPDKTGAEVAYKLKLLANTSPILITAFDKQEVIDDINTTLAAYDDCLSWLKKPVRAETVVAIAKRFCEGKYRTQRRIICHVPTAFELEVVYCEKNSTKSTKINTKKKELNDENLSFNFKIMLPALVTDCSIGGIKLKIDKKDLKNLKMGDSAIDAIEKLKMGDFLSCKIPPWEQINIKQDDKYIKQFLNSLIERKKQKIVNKEINCEVKELPSLKAKIMWLINNNEHNFVTIGVQSESLNISQKLFNSVLLNNI